MTDAVLPSPHRLAPPHDAPHDVRADHLRLAPLDLLRDAVWIFDIDRRRVYWGNQASLAVWNARDLAELCGRDLGRDMSASVAQRLAQYQSDFLAHDAHFEELWTLYPTGKPVSLDVHYRGYRLPDGRMAMFCQGRPAGTGTPDALRSTDALLHTPVMISLYRVDGTPLYRNPAARASARAHGETLAERCADPAAGERLLALAGRHGSAALTLPVLTAQGQCWHRVSVHCQRDAVTGNAALLVSEVDITTLKESEAKALFLSMHDPLTGLANRKRIRQRFDELAHEGPGGTPPPPIALVLIDLDRFKDINDSLGHAAGDGLLVQVAARLKQAVREGDLVARFGGDEFLILLHGPGLRAEVGRIDLRIRELMGSTLRLANVQVHVGATAGVSLFPEDGADFDTLLQHADLAMYSAKAGGRNALAFYEPRMGAALRARTALEADLRLALQERQFTLYYQPRVDIATGRIAGAEALVRWHHPRRGLLMPGDFIPVCEATGLIQALGHQVFEMAAQQQAAWNAQGRALRLSVNLSPREFDAPGLPADLRRTLAASGCPPESLELEVTESMLMGDNDRPLQTLQAMRGLGLSIALDDFGTGYSNLAYLQRFPFSVLKIDRTFVQAPAGERPLAEAIITMSRHMGLSTVAEGVETREQLDWLAGLGVAEYQGFLFAPPLPVAAFEALLARQQAR